MAGPRASNALFPKPPTTPSIRALFVSIQGIIDYLSAVAVDLDPPGPIPNPQVSANDTAILLTWEPAKKASIYRIHRGFTGDFDQSSIIAEVAASKTKVARYQYQDAQDLAIITRYYWLVPLNEAGLTGPKTGMLQVDAVGTSSGVLTVENSAFTTILDITSPTGATLAGGESGGGVLQYTLSLYDGTDVQVETGSQYYVFGVNSVPTFAGTMGAIGTAIQSLSGGTLSTVIGMSGPSIVIGVTSSLGVLTGTLRYTVTNNSSLTLVYR